MEVSAFSESRSADKSVAAQVDVRAGLQDLRRRANSFQASQGVVTKDPVKTMQNDTTLIADISRKAARIRRARKVAVLRALIKTEAKLLAPLKAKSRELRDTAAYIEEAYQNAVPKDMRKPISFESLDLQALVLERHDAPICRAFRKMRDTHYANMERVVQGLSGDAEIRFALMRELSVPDLKLKVAA